MTGPAWCFQRLTGDSPIQSLLVFSEWFFVSNPSFFDFLIHTMRSKYYCRCYTGGCYAYALPGPALDLRTVQSHHSNDQIKLKRLRTTNKPVPVALASSLEWFPNRERVVEEVPRKRRRIASPSCESTSRGQRRRSTSYNARSTPPARSRISPHSESTPPARRSTPPARSSTSPCPGSHSPKLAEFEGSFSQRTTGNVPSQEEDNLSGTTPAGQVDCQILNLKLNF